MSERPSESSVDNAKVKAKQAKKTQSADYHLGCFELHNRKGDLGQSFSHLSLALELLPSLKSIYYTTYLEIFEKWVAVVEEDHGFKDSMTLCEVALNHYPKSADLKHLLSEILYRKMSFEVWRSLFKECLSGGRGSQYCDEVAPLLMAVDQGIKPSILWDVCTADTNALLNLLNQAQLKGLIVSKLALVELDLDVIIVNISVVSHVLKYFLKCEPTWLIDITESNPKVASSENHRKFQVHLDSIITQLEKATTSQTTVASSSSSITEESHSSNSEAASDPTASTSQIIKAVQVKLPNDVNLSTVFGCMLGYPHIYWWEGDSDGKSLGGMPLKVFKFTCDTIVDSLNPVELFSFSIPEALESELRPGIEQWGNRMNVKVEDATNFSNAKFKCDSVLCLSVAL